jgi:hypothetical protein
MTGALYFLMHFLIYAADLPNNGSFINHIAVMPHKRMITCFENAGWIIGNACLHARYIDSKNAVTTIYRIMHGVITYDVR